jgi:hypothetical protein
MLCSPLLKFLYFTTMNSIKKYLGIVWMLLGPLVIVLLMVQAYAKITEAYAKVASITQTVAKAAAADAATNMVLQWGIIIFIFIPIAAGLVIFGKYAWQNEYSQ